MLDVIHRLRRDEDELAANGALRSLNDHAHAALAVDAVHEDVAIYVSKSVWSNKAVYLQLVEAADRRAHGVPESEKETDSRV